MLYTFFIFVAELFFHIYFLSWELCKLAYLIRRNYLRNVVVAEIKQTCCIHFGFLIFEIFFFLIFYFAKMLRIPKYVISIKNWQKRIQKALGPKGLFGVSPGVV